MSDLSDEDLKQLTDLLSRLEQGFLPFEVFVQIARLTVLSIIELVPMRLTEAGKIEVLLLPRDADDRFWPGELHTPGTVLRPTDVEAGISGGFQRIQTEELHDTDATDPVFVNNLLQATKRGTEYLQVYFCEIKGEPKTGSFYDAENLPANVMESQKAFIRQAVETFKASKLN